MKLALIDPNGSARCLLCTWDWKVPSHKRGKLRSTLVLLTKDERVNLLEERILAHLRDSHDRIMLIREEVPLREKLAGLLPKIYYNGRSPYRR